MRVANCTISAFLKVFLHKAHCPIVPSIKIFGEIAAGIVELRFDGAGEKESLDTTGLVGVAEKVTDVVVGDDDVENGPFDRALVGGDESGLVEAEFGEFDWLLAAPILIEAIPGEAEVVEATGEFVVPIIIG